MKYQESQMIVDDLTSKVNRLTTTVTNLEHSSAVLEKVIIAAEKKRKLVASLRDHVRDYLVQRVTN